MLYLIIINQLLPTPVRPQVVSVMVSGLHTCYIIIMWPLHSMYTSVNVVFDAGQNSCRYDRETPEVNIDFSSLENKYPAMSEENEKPSEIGRLEECVVRELCQDYARMTRVNISEEHGQVWTRNILQGTKDYI